MPGGGAEVGELVANDGPQRGALRENGRMGARGEGQFLLGSLEPYSGQRDLERLFDRVKHRPSRRKPSRKKFSHTDFLSVLFSSRRRHACYIGDWSSDVCSSD